MDISERVEELSTTVGDLCQDYHIPVDSAQTDAYLHIFQDTAYSKMEGEEEDFQTFCQNHTYLMGNTHHLGYSTLPLPPTRGGRTAITVSAPHPKRSQSYEGHHTPLSTNFRHSTPRNSYPQSTTYEDRWIHQDRTNCYRPRPLSYQEISYDENDYEETTPEGSWSELSCP